MTFKVVVFCAALQGSLFTSVCWATRNEHIAAVGTLITVGIHTFSVFLCCRVVCKGVSGEVIPIQGLHKQAML